MQGDPHSIHYSQFHEISRIVNRKSQIHGELRVAKEPGNKSRIVNGGKVTSGLCETHDWCLTLSHQSSHEYHSYLFIYNKDQSENGKTYKVVLEAHTVARHAFSVLLSGFLFGTATKRIFFYS